MHATWASWTLAALAPALTCLLLPPLLVYVLFPPTLCRFDNRRVGAEGLAELGPMTRREKILLVLFVLAILGWATGSLTGLDAISGTLAFAAATLITGVISWDKLVARKSAWSTLIWYGGIVGIADALDPGQVLRLAGDDDLGPSRGQLQPAVPAGRPLGNPGAASALWAE